MAQLKQMSAFIENSLLVTRWIESELWGSRKVKQITKDNVVTLNRGDCPYDYLTGTVPTVLRSVISALMNSHHCLEKLAKPLDHLLSLATLNNSK